MALAIDSSCPTFTSTDTSSVTTVNTFSPPAQSVIYLFVCCTGPSTLTYTAQAVVSITDNVGANLNWTLAARDNCANKAAIGGCAEVWWAYCPNAQTNMQLTVTTVAANSSTSNVPAGLIQPVVFTGAKANQAGAATAILNSTVAGLPSLSLTTTAAGSWVLGIVQNWTNQTLPTVPAGQTVVINGNSQVSNPFSGDAYWVQRQSSSTANAGTSVTINDTAPSVVSHMAIVEVLADAPMNMTWIKA